MDGKKDPWALVGLVSWRTSPSKSFTDANTGNKACKEGKSLIYYKMQNLLWRFAQKLDVVGLFIW